MAGADLSHLNHRLADLTGADVTGSVMDGAVLKSARWDPTTIWTNGFDPESQK